MRRPMSSSIAHKKPGEEITKKQKTDANAEVKKVTSSKKDSGAPKKPIGAFFLFMDEFRKKYKMDCPDIKSATAPGKAGGEKWNSLSRSEKAVYVEEAAKRMTEYKKAFAEYEKAMEAKNNKNDGGEEGKVEEPEKSASVAHKEEEAIV